MRKHAPGYVPEKRGNRILHRVRVEGNKQKRITIPVGPDHPDFWEHYYSARAGEKHSAPAPKRPPARTFEALIEDYLDWLAAGVEAGRGSPLTLKQRRSLLRSVAAMPAPDGTLTVGAFDADLPPEAMLHIQDQWGARTSQADNSIKALRAVYKWGMQRGRVRHNPAANIANIHVDQGGATPWTIDDMKMFLTHHPEGSMARLWLLLAAFTGARRGDLITLGHGHEIQRDGVTWLAWQPGKKGSSYVEIPMAPQLFEATRANAVLGPTYLLNAHGSPFKSAASFGMRVQRWTMDAGLNRRSSHGLRKALGGLLAEAGASEHQIMAVLAHSSPKTAAKYTKSAERIRMAGVAMSALRGLRL